MIIRKVKVTEYEYQAPINYVAGATEPDIQFQLIDYEIPSGATGRVYVGRSDGTFEYTVATISGNNVTVAPTSSMFSVKGPGAIQVTLYVGNEVVKNFAVPVYVHADLADDSAEAGSDVTGVFRAAEEEALADFAEDAEAKAAEVIESIPADYTELTEEVDQLNERLQNKAFDIGSYNRFNPSTVQYGIITKTGAIVPDETHSWIYSDYIPVTAGEVLYGSVGSFSVANFAMYDKNYQIVSNSSNFASPFTVPEDVAFMRLTVRITYKDTAYLSSKPGFDTFKGITPYFHEKIEGFEDTLFDVYTNGNLIDKTKLVANSYVNGAVDGALKSASGFYATDYIPVKAGMQYYGNQNYLFKGYAAFYNANTEYISGYGNAAGLFWTSPLTAPANAAYARFTILAANINNAWLSEVNRMATKPEAYSEAINIRSQYVSTNPAEYTGNEITVFTKILCIGDSLTDGFFNESNGSRLVIRKRAYPARLQALTGIECTNLGESGMTSAQWYTAHESDDLSGHDACIIQLGVNDQLQNVSEADMDTALTSIVNKVKADNNGIKIFIATILPANGYMTADMRTRSQMIRDFVTNLNDPNVYLVDLWTYGHTDDYLAYDAGHLSALGYLRLAEDYKAYISSIISNNKDDFRYVQFIGTNYTYTGMSYMRDIRYS